MYRQDLRTYGLIDRSEMASRDVSIALIWHIGLYMAALENGKLGRSKLFDP